VRYGLKFGLNGPGIVPTRTWEPNGGMRRSENVNGGSAGCAMTHFTTGL